MEERGSFLPLYRKIIHWEWYDSPNHLKVWIHILATVNYKTGKWHGVEILPGQRILSYAKLANETKLTIRVIRTIVKDLKSTHEVTWASTSQWSIVTVCRWLDYVRNDTRSDRPATGQRQASDNNNRSTRRVERIEKNNIKSDDFKIMCDEIISYLNDVTGKQFRPSADKNKKPINARLNEGYELKDFIHVIDVKNAEWKDDKKQKEWIRPSTLFGTGFENYINQQKQVDQSQPIESAQDKFKKLQQSQKENCITCNGQGRISMPKGTYKCNCPLGEYYSSYPKYSQKLLIEGD